MCERRFPLIWFLCLSVAAAGPGSEVLLFLAVLLWDRGNYLLVYFKLQSRLSEHRSQLQVRVEMGVLCFLHCWEGSSRWGEGNKPIRAMPQNNLLLSWSFLCTACALRTAAGDGSFNAVRFLCEATLSPGWVLKDEGWLWCWGDDWMPGSC